MKHVGRTSTEVNPHHKSSNWPLHVGILNDYVAVPYANGSSFASQFLYREFLARGQDVTVIGPDNPNTPEDDLPARRVCLKSVPFRPHPGVRLPLPTRQALREVSELGLDITLGQTGSELNDVGIWLRATKGVPFVSVNTIHLPSVYNVMLPDGLYRMPWVNRAFVEQFIPRLERHSASVYNQGDGLIVLSKGLKRYWEERGVKVPIFVIPRSVDPSVFDREDLPDPFPAGARKGGRLLVVCRMTREKNVERLLDLFGKYVAPALPHATLTLVGDGPDYDAFVQTAERLNIADRVFFLGERSLSEIPAFYQHADLFTFTSLSETYGQVVSEALFCGLPVVALADGMGVSQQVDDGVTGVLVETTSDEEKTNWRFAKEVVALILDPGRRAALGRAAERIVRHRASPERCVRSYYSAFEDARRHCQRTLHLVQERRKVVQAQALLRWTWVHLTVATLGLVRPPATVNRNGTKQPGWDVFDARDSQPNLDLSENRASWLAPKDPELTTPAASS